MTKDIGAAIGCLAMAAILFVGFPLGIGVVVEATFTTASAEIESLRADAAVVSADVGEDVIGQVTQWNQTIERNRVMNGWPVIGFFISDRWESVERIEVPR